MKATLLLGSLLVSVLVCSDVNTCAPEHHNQWIAATLEQIRSIQTGMTRADLEKMFRHDGGLTFGHHDRYVYRNCPSIKIDVDFETRNGDLRQTRPGDRITKLSKPYLEEPYYD